ncbi:hypothetical protein [Marseilla massiliensis]|uniref:hypothetical protein n=1 Tax=Marseilla massiliensis TaxID=1841864 RepID=UPI002011DC85|nr:hypothetical protein [Marseilla massiliensis]MCL1610893.1 hypothetical protein [Marseilla massiliensis]
MWLALFFFARNQVAAPRGIGGLKSVAFVAWQKFPKTAGIRTVASAAPPARCHTESIFNYWFYKTAERPTDNAADDAKRRPSLCQGNAGAG